MHSTHILFVEDNPGDVALARMTLHKAALGRFTLSVAERVEDAADALRQETFDLVLLDLCLPDSSGLETLERVAELAPELPIIILSGQDDEGMALRAVREGAQDYILKSSLDAQQMAIAINGALIRKEAELRLARRAFYDELTGLPTRALLQDRWARARARQRRSQNDLGVLVIDLDDFKFINDNHGHVVGDVVLQVLAERLTNVLRRGDTLARFGGDEFVALLEDIEGEDSVAHVNERIASAMLVPIPCRGRTLVAPVSIGTAIVSGDQRCDLADAVNSADLAMYRRKREKSSVVAQAPAVALGPAGVQP